MPDRSMTVGSCVNLTPPGRPVPISYGPGARQILEEQMNPRRYRLVQDDSCHWYVIGEERLAAWHELDFSDGVTPDWARRIDGYHSLTFTDPKEE